MLTSSHFPDSLDIYSFHSFIYIYASQNITIISLLGSPHANILGTDKRKIHPRTGLEGTAGV